MIHYADSTLLVKLYALEPNSPAVSKLIIDCPGQIPFTPIHHVEVRTAMRARRFRGEITPAQLAAALADLDSDLATRRWQIPELSLEAVFRRTEAVSAAQVEARGCRTLDLLHVASALELDASEFLSFDHRQRQVAQAAGLKVRP